jgi:uncharacterized membrane-anchored protein YitT (DUF2179 family)
MTLRRGLAIALDYLLLTAGALCIALSLDMFLIPNNVVSGGLTGIAQILRSLFGTPVGVVSLLLNLPLFVLGWRYLGGITFGVRTIYATALLSFAIDALAPFVTRFVVHEPLLYVFYGGLLDGIGVGLVFRARGTTGGVDIVARFLQQWRGIRPGQGLLLLSVLIFAAAGWVYGATPVLYALLVSFMSGRVVDLVLEGYSYARSAIIISNKPDEIRSGVLTELGRGVTVLEGQGGYTAVDKPVLLCVITQSEESFLKELVAKIDPHAFVVISVATEVLGEGFKVRRTL